MRKNLWEVQQLQNIVDNFQAEEIDGSVVDVQSANLIVTIFYKMNEANQQRLLAMPIAKAANVAWKLVS